MNSTKKFDVIVGIGARDDERETIIPCVLSIKESLQGTNKAKIVICFNDYFKKINKVVSEYLLKTGDSQVDILISRPGIINAQREIVKKYPSERYVFVDADSTITSESITSLLRALEDENTVICYGSTHLLFSERQNIYEKIYENYSSQRFLTKRYYLHGRFYASKKMVFPSTKETDNRIKTARIPFYLVPCVNQGPLMADDIYLSYVVLKKFGFNSIREVEGAVVECKPISTLLDFYLVFRRTKIELIKLRYLYPEFNEIQEKIRRRTCWSKWWGDHSVRNKVLWILYLMMNLLFHLYFYVELVFVNTGITKAGQQWESPLSTK